jgi:hypothetical protein
MGAATVGGHLVQCYGNSNCGRPSCSVLWEQQLWAAVLFSFFFSFVWKNADLATKIFDISVLILGFFLNIYLRIISESVDFFPYLPGENVFATTKCIVRSFYFYISCILRVRKAINNAVALDEPPKRSVNVPAVRSLHHPLCYTLTVF